MPEYSPNDLDGHDELDRLEQRLEHLTQRSVFLASLIDRTTGDDASRSIALLRWRRAILDAAMQDVFRAWHALASDLYDGDA